MYFQEIEFENDVSGLISAGINPSNAAYNLIDSGIGSLETKSVKSIPDFEDVSILLEQSIESEIDDRIAANDYDKINSSEDAKLINDPSENNSPVTNYSSSLFWKLLSHRV
ncbi:hypothetical protein L1887_11726 [Cichorium endivia]|nr:hypothetical protein L1887_11726 [Cichorium endivia]